MNNPLIDVNLKNCIRNLEEKYSEKSFSFLSVKNLEQLYYPRFELNESNSKECYSAFFKPYIKRKKIYPCAVSKIINGNHMLCSIEDCNLIDLKDRAKEMRKSCDDCASIFENDFLRDIDNMKCNINYKFYICNNGGINIEKKTYK